MKKIKVAAVPTSPVLFSKDKTVEKVIKKIAAVARRVCYPINAKIQNLLTTVASGAKMSAPRITASTCSLF